MDKPTCALNICNKELTKMQVERNQETCDEHRTWMKCSSCGKYAPSLLGGSCSDCWGY